MVKATVEIQFVPQGGGFDYDPKASAEDKSASLKTVLAACDDLKRIFDGLLPPGERTWWKGLELEVVGGQVPTATIVKELSARLAGCKQTAEEFASIAADLPGSMSLATGAGGGFPSQGAKEYSIPDNGVRCYYLTPEGTIKCCLSSTLKVDGKLSNLAYQEVVDGYFTVALAVHFEVPAVA